jgi:hypothetical protein
MVRASLNVNEIFSLINAVQTYLTLSLSSNDAAKALPLYNTVPKINACENFFFSVRTHSGKGMLRAYTRNTDKYRGLV